MSLRGQVRAYTRLAWGLRSFLKHPVTLAESRVRLRDGVQRREASFLRIAREFVYGSESSPYRGLLHAAGCEYGDLEKMVEKEGLDGTLRSLHANGVYVTSDEFKGRKEAVRGSVRLTFQEQQFKNPHLPGIQTASSGSRGAPTVTTMNLGRLHYLAHCCAVMLDAHHVAGLPIVLWMPALPSSAGMAMLLYTTKVGSPPRYWFSPVSDHDIRPAMTKRLATCYIVHVGRILGTPIPRPRYVAPDHAGDVARSIAHVAEMSGGCVVFSTPSNAVRACHQGIDLSGATFVVSGEPLSEAKNREIRACGARAINLYASTESGVVGFGCAGERAACDDIHVLLDSQAVIQHRTATAFMDQEVDSLLFTTLSPVAARVLLNVEIGDCGIFETRSCGCAFEELGMNRHLHTIHSFDKLTGEGVTFVGTEFVRMIEEVLPGRFGGRSTDYQIIEEEDSQGRTRLAVVIDPSVGTVDEAAVIDAILRELAAGGDTRRMMAETWARADALQVRRERPRVTVGGKLLPLHVAKTRRG